MLSQDAYSGLTDIEKALLDVFVAQESQAESQLMEMWTEAEGHVIEGLREFDVTMLDAMTYFVYLSNGDTSHVFELEADELFTGYQDWLQGEK